MKKIFSLTTIFMFIFVAFTNTISCSKVEYDNTIWVITDGGTISDKSFNEYSYIGANNYIHNIEKSNKDASYYEVPGNNANDFDTAYKLAKIAGAQIAILPGFRHGPYLSQAVQYLKNIILLDYNNPNNMYSNVVGITYEAEVPSFESGLASFFWMNKFLTTSSSKFKYAEFGGLDNPSAINNYMWGLIAANLIFNLYISGDLTSTSFEEPLNNLKNDFGFNSNENLKPIQLVDIQQDELNNSTSYNYNNWFSGSFIPGKGVDLSKLLIDTEKADLVMPIAGSQTFDVLNVAQQYNKNLKVIGVDSPQGSLLNGNYPELNNPIITSAQKNVDKTVEDVLNELINNNDQEHWLGKTLNAPQTKGTNEWIGIEDMPNIDNNTLIKNDLQNILSIPISNIDFLTWIINWYNQYGLINWENTLKDTNNHFKDDFLKAIKNSN